MLSHCKGADDCVRLSSDTQLPQTHLDVTVNDVLAVAVVKSTGQGGDVAEGGRGWKSDTRLRHMDVRHVETQDNGHHAHAGNRRLKIGRQAGLVWHLYQLRCSRSTHFAGQALTYRSQPDS